MIRTVFFGTPDYSLKILEAIHKYLRKLDDGSGIVAVVTQNPKPAGRNKILEYSAVDKWAHNKKVPVFHCADDVAENNIRADVGVLASYKEIIPKEVLSHFPHGIINFHPSPLPSWRGASPVQASIISGKKETGGTFIKLDEDLDHGPIVNQFRDEILANDTTETLRNRLFDHAAEIIPSLLDAYIKNKITLKPQDHKKATFSRQLTKEEGFVPGNFLQSAINGKAAKVDWEIAFIDTGDGSCNQSPTIHNIYNFIRAMQPWPIAWTQVLTRPDKKNPKRLKILKAHLENSKLVIDEVQLEGKNPVTWKQFNHGYPEFTFYTL